MVWLALCYPNPKPHLNWEHEPPPHETQWKVPSNKQILLLKPPLSYLILSYHYHPFLYAMCKLYILLNCVWNWSDQFNPIIKIGGSLGKHVILVCVFYSCFFFSYHVVFKILYRFWYFFYLNNFDIFVYSCHIHVIFHIILYFLYYIIILYLILLDVQY